MNNRLESTRNYNYDEEEFNIDSNKALAWKNRMERRSFDNRRDQEENNDWKDSYFYQIYDLAKIKPAKFFRSGGKDCRPWKIIWKGMNAIDAGGPFREVNELMCNELQSKHLPFFTNVPNSLMETGSNRDKFIPLSSSISAIHLSVYQFIGRWMGLCLRIHSPLNLRFPSLIWRALLGENITINDIIVIDSLAFETIDAIGSLNDSPPDLFDAAMSEVKFVCIGSDGREKELIEGGRDISLNWINKEQYKQLIIDYRLNEFNAQLLAMRAGLISVIPADALSLYSWKDLEAAVCGQGVTKETIDLLERMTEIEYPYDRQSPVYRYLFNVLRNRFDDEERSLFVQFVGGRSRLPNDPSEFERKFCISELNATNPDERYPISHTCSFSIELPNYTSEERLYERVRWAIKNCREIDAD